MPESARPVVGITGPDRGGMVAWLFAALAVWRAGGYPRRIRPQRPVSIEELNALVIGGGMDVNPSLYGGEAADVGEEIKKTAARDRHPVGARLWFPVVYFLRRLLSLHHAPASTDPARDALEVALIKAALAAEKPVLGICRGAQLLNAALGGSLHRETRGFYTETPYIRSVLPRKRISIVPDTRLALLWPLSSYHVNSLHHQAVDRLAAGLAVAAREDNGLIQAVEQTARPFVMGVQWHPEFLPHVPAQQLLFRQLVQCARSCA